MPGKNHVLLPFLMASQTINDYFVSSDFFGFTNHFLRLPLLHKKYPFHLWLKLNTDAMAIGIEVGLNANVSPGIEVIYTHQRYLLYTYFRPCLLESGGMFGDIGKILDI